MTTTQIPEGLELNKDGTTTIHLDDQRLRLRRPKLREFRQIRDNMWAISDNVGDALAEQRGRVEDLKDQLDGASDETLTALKRELRVETRKLTRESQRLAGEEWARWAAGVIGLLADREVDVDDLPPWCASADFASQLEEHWITVPTRRGAQ